jgi:Squalene-hopene cyclase C-terminal domain
MEAHAEKSFVENVCLPFLRNSQNTDGGWGFHPGAASRTESTCWALLALNDAAWPASADYVKRGAGYVRRAQRADGSWPATDEETNGCWVTSLACLTLVALAEKQSADAIAAGLRWLVDDWPRDSTLWRRFLARFSPERQIVRMNNAYRGWGWTPGTSSWVEPTSFALLALEVAPREVVPQAAAKRRDLATAMLYDRMCPGGGWNCGNPSVYGVAGEPLVVPTIWALMALRGNAHCAENVETLTWLEREAGKIQGPGSLALARICLATYGRAWPSSAPKLQDLHRENEFLQSVQVTAWACLAASPQPAWLTSPTAKV